MNLIPPLFMIQAFLLRLYHLTCDLGGDSRAVSPHDDGWGARMPLCPSPSPFGLFLVVAQKPSFQPQVASQG